MENVNILDSYINFLQSSSEEVLNEALLSEGAFSKLADSYKKNVKVAKSVLSKYGISVSLVEKRGKVTGKKIGKLLSEKNQKGALKVWRDGLQKLISSPEVKQVIEKLPKQVAISLLMVLSLILLNSTLVGMFGVASFFKIPFFGYLISRTGMIVTMGVIAPFLEEAAKRIAILGKFPWLYTGIFSVGEFLMYIMQGSLAPAFIVGRIIGVIHHFVLTKIQKIFHDKAEVKDKKFISYIGFMIAFAIHASNNIVAVLQMGHFYNISRIKQ